MRLHIAINWLANRFLYQPNTGLKILMTVERTFLCLASEAMLLSLLLGQKPDIQDSVCCKTQLYQIEKCRPTKEPCEVSDPEAERRTAEEVWIFILGGGGKGNQ